MSVQLNSGRWTDEEHQGFLRGLEVYGYGNWNAIAIFVPSRSPPQIEAYAQQQAVGGVQQQQQPPPPPLPQQQQQQHQAQPQGGEQRQVWSRAGLVPDPNDPDSEEAMRRQIDTNGVCYGML